MTYWISDFSALVLRLVGLVGPVRGLNLRQVGLVGLVREPKLSTPPYGGGGGGLKISTIFLLFLFHEDHKSSHERERAPHPAFLSADTIRLSADFLIASADRIRKPADTIRKVTGGIRLQTSRKMKKSSFFEVKNYKNRKISPKTILQNPPTKKKFGRSTLFSR